MPLSRLPPAVPSLAAADLPTFSHALPRAIGASPFTFGLPLIEADLPLGLCTLVSSEVVLRFQGQTRNFPWTAVLSQGHEGEMSRVGVANLTCEEVFRFNPNPNFHGCSSNEVEACLESDEFTNEGRAEKVDPVNGGSDHVGPGVPESYRPGGGVDELHDDTPVDIACGIGMLGVHDLCHDDSAVAYSLGFHVEVVSMLKNAVSIPGKNPLYVRSSCFDCGRSCCSENLFHGSYQLLLAWDVESLKRGTAWNRAIRSGNPPERCLEA